MSNKHVIHRKSALGVNMKVASLVQNLIRRMKNTSELVNMDTRLKIINEYTNQLYIHVRLWKSPNKENHYCRPYWI